MKSLEILYLGVRSGTCLDRANALRRLGHRVEHINPREWLPKSVWVDRIIFRLGGQVFSPLIREKLTEFLTGRRFDLVYVDNGELISPMVFSALRKLAPKVINYNIDDPTGPRDKQRFLAYRRAASYYDLLAVVRNENIQECFALGAKRVIRVWRSADEVTHRPRIITPEIQSKWASDVLFLGTWMPERGAFLLKLVELGVPLTICGSRWQKAPEWPKLKAHWRCGELKGDEYAYAIQCAKVSIGLLSKGNRDLHTTRSLEIPSLGGLLCAERTTEHLECYVEGKEALFWSDPEECARACKSILETPTHRKSIAEQGRNRFLSNKHGNEDIMRHILNEAMKAP